MAMRNYRAMNPDKLRQCVVELRGKRGDAYERVVRADESLDAHLNAAESAASMKGVTVPGGTETAEEVEEPASTGPAPRLRFIKPVNAYDVNGDFGRIPTSGWVMEPKFDGWRWQVHVTKLGVMSVGGRNGKRHDGAAPNVDRFLTDHLPECILDGEVLWEDGKSSRATEATFVAFDVLEVEGENTCKLPWTARRGILDGLLGQAEVQSQPYSTNGGRGIVRTSPVAAVSEDLFERWLELGLEGCVAKRESSVYAPGARRQDLWLKVKPQATTDAIVLGWEYGEGASNRDRCGALVVELVETGVKTTTGFDATPEEANAMTRRRVELAHYGWYESGKVRHPIYKRLRPDLEEAK